MNQTPPTPASNAIETVGLSKTFGRISALSDLNLRVPVGAIYGFLGPNGAGKTTTIRLLLGFAKPSHGTATIFGADCWRQGVAARHDLGYLVPPEALDPDLRGHAFLDYTAKLSSRPPGLRPHLCDVLNLRTEDLKRPLGTYSKGMRQKLALIGACQHDPSLLILDEPTDGLDPLIQRAFEDFLKERKAAGRTIFFSSHDLAEVERACDQVAVVRAGHLVVAESMTDMTSRGLRSATIVFRENAPSDRELLAIPGVHRVSRHGERHTLAIESDPNPLVRFLADRDLADFQFTAAGLDDIFMGFYGNGDARHEPLAPLQPQPASAPAPSPSATTPRPPASLPPVWRSVLLILGRSLRRSAPSLLTLALLIALFELVNPLAIDSIPGGAEAMDDLFQSLPPVMQAITRTQPQFMSVAGLPGYLSIGFTHPIFQILQIVLLVGFGCRTLAGEMERGSIQIPLARSLPRLAVYLAKALAMTLATILVAIAALGGLMAGMLIARPNGNFEEAHLLPTGVTIVALGFAVGGITMLGSALASTTNRAVAWVSVIVIVSYVIDYFAQLWSVIEPLDPYSIFDYYQPALAMVDGTLRPSDLATLAITGLTGMIAGALIFTRRDLPT